MLFLTMSTVQPSLHDAVCEEAGAAEHECAITAFSSVQPFPAQTPGPAPFPPSAGHGPGFPPDIRLSSVPEYLVSPGRDPPFADSRIPA